MMVKIRLFLMPIWALFKLEFSRCFNFVKTNDVAKLIVVLACISTWSSANVMAITFDIQMVIGAMITIVWVFCAIYFFSSLYYLSFRIKKTDYTLPRVLYYCVVVVGVLNFLMKFCTSTNIPAIIVFQVLYLLTLLKIAIELRKVLIQQYLNVKHSVFNAVHEKTGLFVIASTHYGIFGKFTGTPNHYMIGFNKNIKTWFVLGIFLKMDKQGIYLKKVFMSYNEVLLFNETFDKKIINYTKNELTTAVMYSID